MTVLDHLSERHLTRPRRDNNGQHAQDEIVKWTHVGGQTSRHPQGWTDGTRNNWTEGDITKR